jgi:VWFA-related protein
LLAVLCYAAALAQDSTGAQQPEGPTFQSKVDLVLVPVVVRDSEGNPVGNLTKDAFQLFDRGKRQTITSFSAVSRARTAATEGRTVTVAGAVDSGPADMDAAAARPERHLIYLFDDRDTEFADMASVRDAASLQIRRGLAAGDRAAIYTVSGRVTQEFTSDREKLEGAVQKLRIQMTVTHGGAPCPDVSYDLADLILNQGDQQAWQALVRRTRQCPGVSTEQIAEAIAGAAVKREIYIGAQDTRVALNALSRAIRRLAEMPGQRLIVLASPGFTARTPEAIRDTADLIHRAAKANIVISAVEPRGVPVYEADASELAATRASGPQRGKRWLQYVQTSAEAGDDMLADLVEGTGGTLFRGGAGILLCARLLPDGTEEGWTFPSPQGRFAQPETGEHRSAARILCVETRRQRTSGEVGRR